MKKIVIRADLNQALIQVLIEKLGRLKNEIESWLKE